MSEREIREGKIVIASAGLIIYRWNGGKLEVLVGERQNEPWSGCLLCVFGGLINGDDADVPGAGLREGREETGGKMTFKTPVFLNWYGPRSEHHLLSLGEQNQIEARPTGRDISDKYKFVMSVFAAEYESGEPQDNEEIRLLRFADPYELARNGSEFAFEQALILKNLCEALKPPRMSVCV